MIVQVQQMKILVKSLKSCTYKRKSLFSKAQCVSKEKKRKF